LRTKKSPRKQIKNQHTTMDGGGELTREVYFIKCLAIPTLTMGLVGSFLSFLVFSREKFSTNSISIYFRALAVSDTVILIYPMIIWTLFTFNIHIPSQSDLSCKINLYIHVGFTPISIWILVAFSLDKMIHVLQRAASFAFIKKRSFQLTIVLSIGAFHSLLYLFVPILLKLKQRPNTTHDEPPYFACNFPNLDHYRFVMGFYILEAAILPSGVMLVTTVFTVKRLFQSRNNLERTQNWQLKERRAKDVKFAMNSIFLNVFSAILQTPIALQFILIIAKSKTWFFLITLYFLYLNFSVSFFIHFAFNSIFRSEFFLMVRIKRARKVSANTAPPASAGENGPIDLNTRV
jgi:hypothetical protein